MFYSVWLKSVCQCWQKCNIDLVIIFCIFCQPITSNNHECWDLNVFTLQVAAPSSHVCWGLCVLSSSGCPKQPCMLRSLCALFKCLPKAAMYVEVSVYSLQVPAPSSHVCWGLCVLSSSACPKQPCMLRSLCTLFKWLPQAAMYVEVSVYSLQVPAPSSHVCWGLCVLSSSACHKQPCMLRSLCTLFKCLPQAAMHVEVSVYSLQVAAPSSHVCWGLCVLSSSACPKQPCMLRSMCTLFKCLPQEAMHVEVSVYSLQVPATSSHVCWGLCVLSSSACPKQPCMLRSLCTLFKWLPQAAMYVEVSVYSLQVAAPSSHVCWGLCVLSSSGCPKQPCMLRSLCTLFKWLPQAAMYVEVSVYSLQVPAPSSHVCWGLCVLSSSACPKQPCMLRSLCTLFKCLPKAAMYVEVSVYSLQVPAPSSHACWGLCVLSSSGCSKQPCMLRSLCTLFKCLPQAAMYVEVSVYSLQVAAPSSHVCWGLCVLSSSGCPKQPCMLSSLCTLFKCLPQAAMYVEVSVYSLQVPAPSSHVCWGLCVLSSSACPKQPCMLRSLCTLFKCLPQAAMYVEVSVYSLQVPARSSHVCWGLCVLSSSACHKQPCTPWRIVTVPGVLSCCVKVSAYELLDKDRTE